jgi:hypothetical protein
MSDDAVKKQAEGVCEEISEKNGWVNFSINVGSTYPIRLSTKLPALVDQGRAAGQQSAVWTYTESQGGENPNKPGTYYMNRRLEGVEVGGTVTAPAANASGSATGGAKTQTVDGTRSSIERQVIVKEMVKYYPALDALTVDGWWGLMGELEEFLANGVPKAAPPASIDAPDDLPF